MKMNEEPTAGPPEGAKPRSGDLLLATEIVGQSEWYSFLSCWRRT